MIYGIGTDVVQIQRIERLHEKYGERFVERLLLPSEADAFRGQSRPGRFLAMRFAAKEAIVDRVPHLRPWRSERPSGRLRDAGQASRRVRHRVPVL
jgi:phosphopantetheine--protein transferase-like protein